MESNRVLSALPPNNRPTVPAPGDYDEEEIRGMMIGRRNRSTRRKPAPVPLCLPQTPHAVRTRTRAAAVGIKRLAAWATARPYLICNGSSAYFVLICVARFYLALSAQTWLGEVNGGIDLYLQLDRGETKGRREIAWIKAMEVTCRLGFILTRGLYVW
jgi:hypothetical protein